jgi:hypothetical protein
MKYYIAFLLSLLANFGFGQSSELVFLKGKITCSSKDVKEVNVFNLRSESSSTTDEMGDYTLFVKAGDTLNFSSVQIETKRIVIKEADLTKSILVTALVSKVIALEEVEIKEYKNINAVSLGILDKPAKQYTPAERKVYTATSTPVDGLINAISGRTKMLKKEVVVEKKEMMLQKIENLYGYDFFTTKLKIPKNNVRGFWYYAVEDEKLVAALKTKNKTMITFILTDLSKKYLALLKNETK